LSKIGVIILAAGKGTRMKSEKPKVCFELAGKALIQRVVETSMALGAELIGVVVGYKKELVVKSLNSHVNMRFVEQKNQNGTGDAVKSAKELFADFNGTVFILCGDVPLLKVETLSNMYKIHRESSAKCTVLTMILEDPDKYGRMVRDANNSIKEIVEFKDASDDVRKIKEVNTGIYCFDSKELFKALEKINNNNAQNEYYLTDVLKILYDSKQKIESVILEDVTEAAGINSQVQLAELEKEHYGKIRTHWMNNGVSIENPDTVLIDDDVTIENDVYISAGTRIKGKVHIGKNTFIGANCVIINTNLKDGSRLEGMNVVKDADVDVLQLGWYESVFG